MRDRTTKGPGVPGSTSQAQPPVPRPKAVGLRPRVRPRARPVAGTWVGKAPRKAGRKGVGKVAPVTRGTPSTPVAKGFGVLSAKVRKTGFGKASGAVRPSAHGAVLARFLRRRRRRGKRARRRREWSRAVDWRRLRGVTDPRRRLASVVTRLSLPTVNRSVSAGGGRRRQQPRALTRSAQEGQARHLLASTVRSSTQGSLGVRLAEERRATRSGESGSRASRRNKRSQALGALSTLRGTGGAGRRRGGLPGGRPGGRPGAGSAGFSGGRPVARGGRRPSGVEGWQSPRAPLPVRVAREARAGGVRGGPSVSAPVGRVSGGRAPRAAWGRPRAGVVGSVGRG